MRQEHKTSRLSIEMPAKAHKQLKTLAAVNGLSVKNLVLTCLYDHLLSSNVPNDETVREFEKSERGEELVSCKDVNDLFEKLGLDE